MVCMLVEQCLIKYKCVLFILCFWCTWNSVYTLDFVLNQGKLQNVETSFGKAGSVKNTSFCVVFQVQKLCDHF